MPKFSSITKTPSFSEQFISRHHYFYLLYTSIYRLCYRLGKASFSFLLIFCLCGCISKQILPSSNPSHNSVDQNISYPLQITDPSTSTTAAINRPSADNYSFPTFMFIIILVMSFCFFPYILLSLRYLFYRIKSLTKRDS